MTVSVEPTASFPDPSGTSRIVEGSAGVLLMIFPGGVVSGGVVVRDGVTAATVCVRLALLSVSTSSPWAETAAVAVRVPPAETFAAIRTVTDWAVSSHWRSHDTFWPLNVQLPCGVYALVILTWSGRVAVASVDQEGP